MTSASFGSGPGADPFTFVPTQELQPDQRWSSYDDPGILTGPEPVPDWVITGEAVETEIGILKSGKEADVALIERAAPAEQPGAIDPVVMAAKRYRAAERRRFHRDTVYTETRQLRRSRDRRAVAKSSKYGRAIESGQWAMTEFETLCDLWSAGLPVPYPVQLDGTEILMEFITTADGGGAPRLVQLRPDHDRLADYWQQLYRAMTVLAGRQQAHGDLSAYNILAEDDRLVIIDLPQVVDIAGNPYGMELLARDCRNVCTWFTSRGLPVDADELLSDLVGFAW